MLKQLLILFFLLNLCQTSYAQRLSEGEALSLDEALAIAYRDNLSMKEAREEELAQQGRSLRKRALPDPEAELYIGGLKKQEDGSREQDLDSYTIKQPLGYLGERLTSFSTAGQEMKIAQSQLKMTWGQVRTLIIKLYAQVIAQEKALQFSQDNLNSTRQLFVSVENRFHSGSAMQSELTRAKIEVLQAESGVLTSEKDLKSIKGELNINLGRQPDALVVLSDFLSEETMDYQYQGLVEQALKMRPDLGIEESKLKIRKNDLLNAYSKTIFPEMTVGFERTMEDYENDAAILLEFSYPLWHFGSDIKEARAEHRKQKARLDAFKRQANLDIYQSFLDAELAGRQVKIQKNALDEAHELLRQASVQYEAGEISFIAFLENLRTIKETRLNYLSALGNYKEKIAALDMAVGYVPLPQAPLKRNREAQQ